MTNAEFKRHTLFGHSRQSLCQITRHSVIHKCVVCLGPGEGPHDKSDTKQTSPDYRVLPPRAGSGWHRSLERQHKKRREYTQQGNNLRVYRNVGHKYGSVPELVSVGTTSTCRMLMGSVNVGNVHLISWVEKRGGVHWYGYDG